MGPYPRELRQRVADAYLAGEGSYREIGERFAVSHDFVRDMVLLMRTHGSIEPAPHGGGNYKLGPSGEGALVHLLNQKSDLTLKELGKKLRRQQNVSMTPSGIHRALKRLRVTRKKSHFTPASRSVRTSNPSVSLSSEELIGET